MDHERAVDRAAHASAAARRRQTPETGLGSPAIRRSIWALDRVEQRILKQQIVDRIGRQAQLGKHHQPDARPHRPRRAAQRPSSALRGGSADRHLRHAGADTNELMPVGREERGHRSTVLADQQSVSIWALAGLPIRGRPAGTRSRGQDRGRLDRATAQTTPPMPNTTSPPKTSTHEIGRADEALADVADDVADDQQHRRPDRAPSRRWRSRNVRSASALPPRRAESPHASGRRSGR